MLRVLFIFLCLNIANGESMTQITQTTPAGFQPLWRYDEQNKWPGHRCKIGGRRQSPIDIKTANVIEDYNMLYIKNGPLFFKGYDGVLVTGINNGHTIQFSTEGEDEMHPQLSGGPLDTFYRLEQLHFHWSSEHAINGNKYPMEIHFVHVRSDLTVFDALSRRDGLAIVAVFCKVQSDLDDPPENTQQLMEYIPRLVNIGDRISGVFLNLKKWLSSDTMSYYTYSGSLTSPKCNEAVTWIIFTEPITVTDSQYKLISKIGFGRHNSRDLQELSQHVVYSPPKARIRVPHFVTFFDRFFKSVTVLFKNISTTLVTGITSHYSRKDNIL